MAFSTKERGCEIRFSSKGKFYHMYTDGNSNHILFCSNEDFIYIMNLIGICSCHFKSVHIYTFAIMNNHLHFILECDQDNAEEMFAMLRSCLQRYYIRNGRCVNLSNFKCEFVHIDNLNTLRNEIAYVNRNGYVVRPDCTPFSYPWGAGILFFNPLSGLIPSSRFNELSTHAKRKICHSHNVSFDSDNLRVYDGIILPSSFCKISEAEEMYAAVSALTYKQYNIKHPQLLPAKEKIEVAKRMHYEFNASNRQIKSILRLEISIVDELFPKQ